jgi:hypothetical protein
MNVEIGAEAALIPEKEYIKGISVAVCGWRKEKPYRTGCSGRGCSMCSAASYRQFQLKVREYCIIRVRPHFRFGSEI